MHIIKIRICLEVKLFVNEIFLINVSRCDCENCVIMEKEEECLCCHELAQVTEKIDSKNLKCITQHEGFQGNCLNVDVLEVSLYEFVERDGPIDDNEPIHE